jgi:hypothetical protein
MRIAFIGNHSVDFSTETHHRKTFEKMGHEVVQLQENKTSVREVMAHALTCDMLFWTHTHGWGFRSDNEVRRMLNTLKEKGIPTVGYHLDLWLGLQRERDLTNDPYWNIEHFFTVDKLMADWLNANTKTKGYYLAAGVYDNECVLGTPDNSKYPHEVIFTGSKGYHKEYPYRGQLIEWLHANYGTNFAHYGGGGLPGLRGQELNNLYASAKIVIGDTLCKNFDYPAYFSDRLFEVTGRGGFMIFPNITGLDNFFHINRELITYDYNRFDQLKAKIDYFLENWTEREMVRLAGHERTKREHTYRHRLTTLLNTIFP